MGVQKKTGRGRKDRDGNQDEEREGGDGETGEEVAEWKYSAFEGEEP